MLFREFIDPPYAAGDRYAAVVHYRGREDTTSRKSACD